VDGTLFRACCRSTFSLLWLLFVRFSQYSFFFLHKLLHNSSPIHRYSSSYLSVCIFVLISPIDPYISVFGLLTVVPHPFLSFVLLGLRSPTSRLPPSPAAWDFVTIPTYPPSWVNRSSVVHWIQTMAPNQPPSSDKTIRKIDIAQVST